MGAWSYIFPRIEKLVNNKVRYAGRGRASSPASGSKAVHYREQKALVSRAFNVTRCFSLNFILLMSAEIKVPNFGESITTANVAQWHKSDGDSVAKGDTLVTFETDKVSNDLEADQAGILKITVAEGEEVDIGSVIGSIEASTEEQNPASQNRANQKQRAQVLLRLQVVRTNRKAAGVRWQERGDRGQSTTCR